MTIESVLFFGAHPDDETMIIGGTLAMLAQSGVQVRVVCATRGEGGEMGEPPVTTRANLGAVREAELRCAVEALGAVGAELLDYVDPLVGEGEALYPFTEDVPLLAGQFAAMIERDAPDVVLSHGIDGEYGHPAHQVVHRAARRAVDDLKVPPLFYTIAGNVPGIKDRIWNESEPAHLVLDVTPWLDVKERAALCHKSQHTLFKRRRKLKTVREALRTVESVHRCRPALAPGQMPDDPFAALMLDAGARHPDPGQAGKESA